MARSLYDVGDRRPDGNGSWLNEKEDRRSPVLPIGGMVIALAGAVAVMLLFPGLMQGGKARPDSASRIDATFTLCDDVRGEACVTGPDSFAWKGRLYHVADLRAPSLTSPSCPAEAQAAAQARLALAGLLNGGGFDALPDPDRRRPSARLLMRDTVSLGQLMILKGHGVPMAEKQPDWCVA